MKKQAARGSSDFSRIPERYLGKWIAVKDSRVVASGRTLKSALRESERKGVRRPTLIKVPRPNECNLLRLS
jgi:hypothetical protein